MKPILARCGYRCDLCLAYGPNVAADPSSQQKLSDGWHKYFGFRLPASDICCDGCMAHNARLIDKSCPVRPCVTRKGLDNCSQCYQYVCDRLKERLVVYEEVRNKVGTEIPREERVSFILPYENKQRLDALRDPGENSQRPLGATPAMRYRLAVEDIEPNRWIAWVIDLPGCFSPAQTESDAVAAAPDCIADYFSWLVSHDSSLLVPRERYDTQIIETFHSFPSPGQSDYIVNALFEHDRRPLSRRDLEVALRLLEWTREDLLAAIRGITEDRLNAPLPREVGGSVAGVLRHVGVAENWYMDQMGLSVARDRLPEDPLLMLGIVRRNTKTRLSELAGDGRVLIGDGGELWSGRKVVRRALWHERAHTRHVRRLLGHPAEGRTA